MWANEKTKQAQSFAPWPAGTVVTDEVLAQYADWKQVADDYVMLRTPEEIAQETLHKLESAVDSYMDSKAQILGFRDRHSFALRAGIPGSSWNAKAQVFGAWMDNVNDYCYQVKLDCQQGKRNIPTEAELIAELPALVLP